MKRTKTNIALFVLVVIGLLFLTGQINNGGGSGSQTWPAGGAGIPNYSGSSSWGTSYSASNTIPNNFLGTLAAGSNGLAASATTDTTNAANISSGFLSPARLTQASYASGTQTASIAAATLCSTTNCPAGTYEVLIYANETGTGCTTVGSGIAKVGFNFVDNRSVTVNETQVPLHNVSGAGFANGLTLTTTGAGQASGQYVVNTNGSAVGGTDAIQILTTVVACSSPGSWTGYQVRAYVTRAN